MYTTKGGQLLLRLVPTNKPQRARVLRCENETRLRRGRAAGRTVLIASSVRLDELVWQVVDIAVVPQAAMPVRVSAVILSA